MSATFAEATAPCRVDLAGGDIWPPYVSHTGAVTVSVAIDRRAWCRVETGVTGVRIESKDTLRKGEGKDVAELFGDRSLSLVAHVLDALGVRSGVKVITQSKVPAGSGLGGSSALGVAVAAAAAKAVGRPLDAGGLWPVVRDAEAQSFGVPTGAQGGHAAIHGGILSVHMGPGAVRVEPLRTDPGRVEESMMLVDAGAKRFSGIHDWEVSEGQNDGDARGSESLAAMLSAARGLRDALVAHRYADVASLIAEEWEARKRLRPSVTTPEIDRIAEVARSAGGAARACGAGGGGMVAVWATPGQRGPGRREAVEKSLRDANLRPLSFRVDLRGLEVE